MHNLNITFYIKIHSKAKWAEWKRKFQSISRQIERRNGKTSISRLHEKKSKFLFENSL